MWRYNFVLFPPYPFLPSFYPLPFDATIRRRQSLAVIHWGGERWKQKREKRKEFEGSCELFRNKDAIICGWKGLLPMRKWRLCKETKFPYDALLFDWSIALAVRRFYRLLLICPLVCYFLNTRAPFQSHKMLHFSRDLPRRKKWRYCYYFFFYNCQISYIRL